MAKGSYRNTLEPDMILYANKAFKLPPPDGYRINDDGSVSGPRNPNKDDPYRNFLIEVYQREQIRRGLEAVDKIRGWVAFFGIATILALVVVILL